MTRTYIRRILHSIDAERRERERQREREREGKGERIDRSSGAAKGNPGNPVSRVESVSITDPCTHRERRGNTARVDGSCFRSARLFRLIYYERRSRREPWNCAIDQRKSPLTLSTRLLSFPFFILFRLGIPVFF